MEKKIKHHFVRDGAHCLPFLMTSNTLTSLNYNQVSCLPGIIAPVYDAMKSAKVVNLMPLDVIN